MQIHPASLHKVESIQMIRGLSMGSMEMGFMTARHGKMQLSLPALALHTNTLAAG